jgi:3-oxoadipate enol-lactonase
MPLADHNGVSLHWQEQGEGAPVLLVMGHRYSSAMWYPMIPALAARHRVIWFDNRGTGQSGATRKTSVQEMAADALCVMDAAGVARAHVFGVSMGGVLALELAMQAPQRVISLVLGCTGILTSDKPRLPAFMRALYYLPPWVLKLMTPNRRGAHGYGSAAPPGAIAADMAVLAKDRFVVHGVVAQAAAIADYSTTRDEVGALTMPALVIHGDEDATVRFEWGVELAQTLPNSTFFEVKGAGHNFLVAGGDRARQAVVDFLEAVDRSASP